MHEKQDYHQLRWVYVMERVALVSEEMDNLWATQMLPVASEICPTISGPKHEPDCEKKISMPVCLRSRWIKLPCL